MTHPQSPLEALDALTELEAARKDFVAKRDAMNAARPAVLATPAERALYDERYKADHEAERALHTAQCRFGTIAADCGFAETIRAALTSAPAGQGAISITKDDADYLLSVLAIHSAYHLTDDTAKVDAVYNRLKDSVAGQGEAEAVAREPGMGWKLSDEAAREIAETQRQNTRNAAKAGTVVMGSVPSIAGLEWRDNKLIFNGVRVGSVLMSRDNDLAFEWEMISGKSSDMWFKTLADARQSLESAARSWLSSAAPVAGNVPEGWKLVPIEPTQDMLDEVTSSEGYEPWTDKIMREVYQNMLAASPQQRPKP